MTPTELAKMHNRDAAWAREAIRESEQRKDGEKMLTVILAFALAVLCYLDWLAFKGGL